MASEFVVYLHKENASDDLQLGRLYEVVEKDAGYGMMRLITNRAKTTCIRKPGSTALRSDRRRPRNWLLRCRTVKSINIAREAVRL